VENWVKSEFLRGKLGKICDFAWKLGSNPSFCVEIWVKSEFLRGKLGKIRVFA
jgi:hypothetical protein